MKRLLCCLLILALLPMTALASGLPSIGGSLPQIDPVEEAAAGVLPDPGDTLSQKATIFAKNYEYTKGYICTVYLYDIPKDEAGFLNDYTAAAKVNGYEVEEVMVDGFSAWKLSYGGKHALLLPQYSGRVMLMVENGMEFGEAKPEGSYMMFTLNGKKIVSTDTSKPTCKLKIESYNPSHKTRERFTVSCWFNNRNYANLLDFDFAGSATTGDVFRTTKNSFNKSLYLYMNGDIYLYYGDSYSSAHHIEDYDDYFEVRITSFEEEKNYYIIEGEFDGRFKSGEDVLEDGSFRVKCGK